MKPSDEPDRTTTKIRILVFNLSGILLELVANLLENQPGMFVVENAEDNLDLLVKAGQNVDIVLLGADQDEPLPNICTHLLNEYTNLKILVLTVSGEKAVMYWLGLRRRKLKTVSSVNLVKSLRRLYDLDPVS
jgi:DNA-binding NarL/FixJ family response regulator